MLKDVAINPKDVQRWTLEYLWDQAGRRVNTTGRILYEDIHREVLRNSPGVSVKDVDDALYTLKNRKILIVDRTKSLRSSSPYLTYKTTQEIARILGEPLRPERQEEEETMPQVREEIQEQSPAVAPELDRAVLYEAFSYMALDAMDTVKLRDELKAKDKQIDNLVGRLTELNQENVSLKTAAKSQPEEPNGYVISEEDEGNLRTLYGEVEKILRSLESKNMNQLVALTLDQAKVDSGVLRDMFLELRLILEDVQKARK